LNASKRWMLVGRDVLVPPLAVVAVVAILGLSSESNYEYGTTLALCINIIALVGLNMIAGHAGQIALGHAALIGTGAYTVVVLGTDYGFAGAATLILAPVISAALAVVIGVPTLRLRGLYFSVGTLAFAVIVDFINNRATSLTGGPDGKIVNPLMFGERSYALPADFFQLVLVFLVVVLVFERLFVRTWVAWGLKAARTSEPAASAAGVAIFSSRLGAFAIAGALAGLAGALSAYQTLYISPSSYTLLASVDLFVVLFIGGMATFIGPVAGAFILYSFERWLSPYPDLKPFALAIVFLLALRFFPGGLGGAINDAWNRFAPSFRTRPPDRQIDGPASQQSEPVTEGVGR
jgi:branched-chain amino acid transport system permease protein